MTQLSSVMVIVGMVNGMIGGTILVLPLLAIQAGIISIALVLPISAFFSYYSAHLCILHLGS